MKMSYNKLWKLLIDKQMKKSDLRKNAGISSSSLAKLGKDENVIISFDCKKLKKLLVPGQYEDLSLSDVLGEITTVEVLPEKKEKHYFVVEMENVSGSTDLLNIDAAKSYISQVAPLPYKTRQFIYISQVDIR